MQHVACETAFTLFTDMAEALSRASTALGGMGFEVKPGPVQDSLLARRPSFRDTPAAGLAINARASNANQTTLSVRAWGKTPRAACEALARDLGVRPSGGGRALQAPGPEDLRGEFGYSLTDTPARARRQLFGGAVGQFIYSAAIGIIAALIILYVFRR